jgi:hypothetical protein
LYIAAIRPALLAIRKTYLALAHQKLTVSLPRGAIDAGLLSIMCANNRVNTADYHGREW